MTEYDPLEEYRGCLTSLIREREERDERIADLERQLAEREQLLLDARRLIERQKEDREQEISRQLAEMRGLLATYGEHMPNCDKLFDGSLCTCGLSKALAG